MVVPQKVSRTKYMPLAWRTSMAWLLPSCSRVGGWFGSASARMKCQRGASVGSRRRTWSRTIDNICLYAVAWVFFFVRGDGLAPLGLVGQICGCGDIGAAEEQGLPLRGFDTSSNGRNASEASFGKARDGWWTVCCSIRALRPKCVNFFAVLGSLVAGL